jgi:hypothetical protein
MPMGVVSHEDFQKELALCGSTDRADGHATGDLAALAAAIDRGRRLQVEPRGPDARPRAPRGRDPCGVHRWALGHALP